MANLQVAVAWAAGAGETEIAMRIGASFVRQALERPLLGTARLAEEALRAPGATEHSLRARALAEAAWGAVGRGDREAGTRMLRESIQAQRHGARYAAAAYSYLLSLVTWKGAHEEAYELASEALHSAQTAGDLLGAIGMRIAFAATAANNGENDVGIEHAERALADARQLDQPTLIAAALFANGVAFARVDPERALAYLYEALERSRRLGLDNEHAASLALVVTLEAFYGDANRALEAMREAISRELEAGYAYWLSTPFYMGHQVFNRVGRPDLVARCCGFSESAEYIATPMHRYWHELGVDEARSVLGPERFAALEAEGAATPPEEFRMSLLRVIDDLRDVGQP